MPQAEGRLSINQIAELAGVSVATISRVINNRGGYSKKTEDAVNRIIREYKYLPNSYASGLRTNRSHSIGVMVPDITNEFFARIIRGLDLFFLKYKYALLICDSNEDTELENMHLKNLLMKNIDGMIYISGKNEVLRAEEAGVPVVYVDRSPKNAQVLVHSDNEYGGYLAGKELLEAGCRKILFFGDIRKRSPVRRRYAGYKKAFHERGAEACMAEELWSYPDYMSAKTRMCELLRAEGCRFDGVFTTNDLMALGTIHALSEFGYRVPQDVKVVGYDNVSTAEFCSPPITTVAQNIEELAQRAGEELLRMIRGEEIAAEDICIPVSLEKRESTAVFGKRPKASERK